MDTVSEKSMDRSEEAERTMSPVDRDAFEARLQRSAGKSEPSSDAAGMPAAWLPYAFKVPVYGWALECVLDPRPLVRLSGLAVFVMSVLLLLLVTGKAGLVIPLTLVTGMVYAAWRVTK